MIHPSDIPFVRLLLPFISGILLILFMPLPWWVCLLLLLMVSGLLALFEILPASFRYHQRWIPGMILILIFFTGGMFRISTALHRRERDQGVTGAEVSLVTVDGFPVERKKTYRFPVKINKVYKGRWYNPAAAKLLVYIYKEDGECSKIRPGQRLWIRGRIGGLPYHRNPDEFNYRRYMADQHFYGQVLAEPSSWGFLQEKPRFTLTGMAAGIQHQLVGALKKAGFEDNVLAVAAALMAGERTLLDPETKQLFSKSGSMHVLAISGLHIGILYYFLFSILAFLERKKYGRYIRVIVVFLVIWMYVLVTGLPASAVRAAIMFSFFLLGGLLSRKAHPLNILAASAFLMLWINPFLIRSAGFLLSYMAVTGIILFYSPLKKLVHFGYVVPDKIWSLVAVSLAAQAGTAPLSLFYFHQFPVWFLLTNLLVIPLVTLVIYGFMGWLVTLPLPFLSTWLAGFLKILLTMLLKLVTLFKRLPLQVIGGCYPSPAQTVWFYLLLFSLLLFLLYRRMAFLYLSQLAAAGILISVSLLLLLPVKKFIVFNVPHQMVIGYRHGNRTVLHDFSARPLPDSALAYYTGRYTRLSPKAVVIRKDTLMRTLTGMHKQDIIYFRNGFFSLSEVRGFFYDSNQPLLVRKPQRKTSLDLLLFSGDRWWMLSSLFRRFSFRQVIIGPDVPAYAGRQLRFLCHDIGVPCYTVEEKGPFVLAF